MINKDKIKELDLSDIHPFKTGAEARKALEDAEEKGADGTGKAKGGKGTEAPSGKSNKVSTKKPTTQGTASEGLVNLSNLKISTKGDSISLSFTTSLNSLNFTFEEFKSLFGSLSGDIELKADSASLKVGEGSGVKTKTVKSKVKTVKPKGSKSKSQVDSDESIPTLGTAPDVKSEPVSDSQSDPVSETSDPFKVDEESNTFDFDWNTTNKGTAIKRASKPSPLVKQFNDYTTSSYNGSKTLAELVDAVDLYPNDFLLSKDITLADKFVTLYNYVPKRVETTVDYSDADFYGSFGLQHLDSKYGVTRIELYDGLIMASNQKVKVEPDTADKLNTLGTANPGVSQLELTLLYYLSEGSVPTENYLKHLRHLRDFALATMYPVLPYNFNKPSGKTHGEYASLSITKDDLKANKSKAVPYATRNALERWVDSSTGQMSVTFEQLSKITKLPEKTITQYTRALGYRPATDGNTVFDQAREMDDIGATRSHIARVTGAPTSYLTLFNGKKEDVVPTEANELPRKLFTLYMSSHRLEGFVARLDSLTESVEDISAALQKLVSLKLILHSDLKDLPSLYKFS